jgi:hypothetical protein
LPAAVISGFFLVIAYAGESIGFFTRPCVFIRLTGYPCPTCGLVRSLTAMAEARWEAAVVNSPLAAVAYLALCVILAWNATALMLGVRLERGRWLRLPGRTKRWIWAGAVAVVLNWVYRLAAGVK